MELLYQDRELVVCIKPFGVLSEGELPQMLRERLGGEIFPVHRLDRETGGCMVYARRKETAARMSALIARQEMEKEYLAVVQGEVEEESGVWRDLLFRDAARGKSFVVQRPRRGVREAELCYRRLETVWTEDGALTLLRVRLITGRTHQIRVQSASRRHPIVGDGRYGSRLHAPHMALWSCRLALRQRGERLCFFAPPPQEFPWTLFTLPQQ